MNENNTINITSTSHTGFKNQAEKVAGLKMASEEAHLICNANEFHSLGAEKATATRAKNN